MKILKNFVVFEGCDGSGTTTQIGILEDFFQRNLLRRNPPQLSLPSLYTTFEPTNGSIGTLIRSALRGEVDLAPKTVALLFAADRNEHIYGPGGIAEHCGRGELVVSDRYLPSSLVYQGITCGEEFPAILNSDFPAPELLLFFDIDPETAQKRISGRKQRDIFEYMNFQIKVRERYKAILPNFSAAGVRVETIDASGTPEEVGAGVWAAIEKMPIFVM
jgi:dTMP kinase